MKKLFLLAFIIIGIQSCDSQSNEFKIEGKVNNSDNEKVYLSEMKVDKVDKIDSVQIKDDGTFIFKGYTNIPKFYMIQVSPRNSVTLIVKPGEEIKLTGNIQNLSETYDVEGSAGSQKVLELNQKLGATITTIDSLGQVFRNNPDKEPGEKLRARLNEESQKLVQDHKEYTKQFIDNNLESLASLMALYQQIGPRSYVLNPKEDLACIQILSRLNLFTLNWQITRHKLMPIRRANKS